MTAAVIAVPPLPPVGPDTQPSVALHAYALSLAKHSSMGMLRFSSTEARLYLAGLATELLRLAEEVADMQERLRPPSGREVGL